MAPKRLKLVFISSMLPSGHFSQILTEAIEKQKKVQLIVYTDTNSQNKKLTKCGQIKTVWDRNIFYVFQILRQTFIDKPDVIHIQQEFNMYGGIITALLFPWLLLLLKLFNNRVVVTIHAAVYKRQVTGEFISLFTIKRSVFIAPKSLKAFFYYMFKGSSMFADKVICHTKMMQEILTKDWGVNKAEVVVIPTGIPLRRYPKKAKAPYFFYFGYMVRRKGIEYLLAGFQEFYKHNKQYKLVMAGGTIPGQEAALTEIKNEIKKRGLSNAVEIRGFIEEKESIELYTQATAVVIPAKVSMGSSGPLYHAQSFGKCILASNVGHFKEDIEHLVDGILVKNNEWDKALELVVENPGLISRIEEQVRIKIREKSARYVAQKHIEVYQHVANIYDRKYLYSDHQ